MRLVDVRDPGATGLVVDALRRSAVVLQLPPVYTLIAAPTSAGVAALNGAKSRLAGKNYGSAVGSVERFWECVDRTSLPDGVDRPTVEGLIGAFVRCVFARPAFDSPTVRGGTHQGLLLPDPWRSLFRAIEDQELVEPALFAGHRYASPLCTSFNRSGDPAGSIVDRDVALAFARERGVDLFVTCEERPESLGSYPILAFGPSGVTVERRGPGLEALLARLPQALRPAA